MNFSGETKKFKQIIVFYKEKLKNNDFSRLKTIKVYFGYSFYAICHFPYIHRNNYLIKCRLNKHDEYPGEIKLNIRNKLKPNMLKRKNLKVNNYKEEMVWVIGHEIFHYLRDTRQIKGKNTEAQANEFGIKCLSEFRRNIATTS